MYLDQLNSLEKVAFSRLAYLLISFYGVDEHEEKLFYSALGEMGIATPDLDGEISPAVEASAFSSARSRRIALLELMLLALADGDIDDDEQNILDFIISQFGFDDETLDAAWTWVKDWYLTYQRGNEFIGQPELTAT